MDPLGTKVKPRERTSKCEGLKVFEERLVMYFCLFNSLWTSFFVCFCVFLVLYFDVLLLEPWYFRETLFIEIKVVGMTCSDIVQWGPLLDGLEQRWWLSQTHPYTRGSQLRGLVPYWCAAGLLVILWSLPLGRHYMRSG